MEQSETRKAGLNDIDRLQEIGRQTFFETYAAGNTEENMRYYLENDFSTERVETELANRSSEFYIAELKANVAGYLKINFSQAQTDIKDEAALEIERIYVLKEYQGQRVGQRLLDKAIDIAKQKQLEYIWLGVWEKNPGARQFYRKNGFVEFGKHNFQLGSDNQTDILMKLYLQEKEMIF